MSLFRELMMQGLGGNLPAGYTLTYYTGSGNVQAFVNTGVYGSGSLTIHVIFAYRAYGSYAAIYSNYMDESHDVNRVILTGSNSVNFFAADGNCLAQQVAGSGLFPYSQDVIVSPGSITWNGVTTTITASSKGTNTSEIALFTSKAGGGSSTTCYPAAFYFSIKNGSTPLLEYIPCIRNLDGVAGFYDTVTSTFKSTSGNIDLLAGPIVI